MDHYAEALELIKASELFDEEWYKNRYPDVVLSSMDPVKHYLKIGALLHRDPGPNFSTLCYLQAYPDVEQARLNPLYHYVKLGKSEGRLAPMSRAALEDRGFQVVNGPLKRDSGKAAVSEASTAVNRKLEQELAQARKECQELAEENQLLLLQLHQVQEELEEYYLKYQELCPRTDTN